MLRFKICDIVFFHFAHKELGNICFRGDEYKLLSVSDKKSYVSVLYIRNKSVLQKDGTATWKYMKNCLCLFYIHVVFGFPILQ
jgi:hypothetical protein